MRCSLASIVGLAALLSALDCGGGKDDLPDARPSADVDAPVDIPSAPPDQDGGYAAEGGQAAEASSEDATDASAFDGLRTLALDAPGSFDAGADRQDERRDTRRADVPPELRCAFAPSDCEAVPEGGDFNCYEDLGYCQFLIDSYPSGLRDPTWGGVYSAATPGLDCGSQICANHRVCSESTALLASLAASRGDRATFEQMVQIWFDPSKHDSAKNHLAHWALDAAGKKIPTSIPGGKLSGYLNASGEETQMLQALLDAGETFDASAGSASRAKASELALSMKEKLFGVPSAAGFGLLRPWWAWSVDADEQPLASTPDKASLNILQLDTYYRASTSTWLPHDLQLFFGQVITPTLNTVSHCAVGSMFHPQYVLSDLACVDENDAPNSCSVLACADIAGRLTAYANHAGVSLPASAQAKSYLDFLEGKYRRDGVLWDAYSYTDGQVLRTTGHPVASMAGYLFLAKLAMGFGRWDLAEKILMEQVIPFQVFPSSDHPDQSGPPRGVDYLGAFRPRVVSPSSCWEDAQAFPNLQAVTSLHFWNSSPKPNWTSRYPHWESVVTMTSKGGIDEVPLDGVETRFVRLLLKRPGGRYGNYSIYEIEVHAPDGTLVAVESASASSVQWDAAAEKAWTADLVFDGISECDSRWSSAMPPSPPSLSDTSGQEWRQWIYLDFGSVTKVSKLLVYWDASYAAEYEVQQGVPGHGSSM